jgi:hypothetical protein
MYDEISLARRIAQLRAYMLTIMFDAAFSSRIKHVVLYDPNIYPRELNSSHSVRFVYYVRRREALSRCIEVPRCLALSQAVCSEDCGGLACCFVRLSSPLPKDADLRVFPAMLIMWYRRTFPLLPIWVQAAVREKAILRTLDDVEPG